MVNIFKVMYTFCDFTFNCENFSLTRNIELFCYKGASRDPYLTEKKEKLQNLGSIFSFENHA